MAKEGFNSFFTSSAEQFRIRVRQSKGNQALNDELKVKANELEKLFAEHKLRTPPGNKSNSTTRITRHNHMQSWPSATSSYNNFPAIDDAFVNQVFENNTFKEPAPTSNSIDIDKSVASCRTKAVHRNYSDELIGCADGSPGKFYDIYMQKRDAKLRDEWNSKGAEKEAKLRAMEDCLERSAAEMKTLERRRSFNSSSSFSRDQQQLVFGQSDDREDMPEFFQQKRNNELRSSSETSLEEVSKHTTPRKKQHLPIKTSSKPRNIVASVPRSPMKVSRSPSSRRKSQPESPLARSVPNLSYMRKENAEPYSPAGKTMTRSQSKTHSRSKLLHSQSLRKSSALNSEGAILAPLKFDKDKMEQSPKSVISTPLKSGKYKMEKSLSDKFHKFSDSKTSLKKGKDADFSSSGGLIESNIASRFANNDNDDDDDMELDSDTSENRDEEDFENMTSAIDENFDNGTPSPSHEAEKLVNSGSENGHVLLRSLSQVCYASEAGLSPCSVPSNFLNSPVSPAYQYPFPYPHEMSDVDSSDFHSPAGSPSSWNSHFLSPTHTDGAARTRKKWGTLAQNPIHTVKSSQSLSRKDKARGFKRLLQFGNKNRGTDSLVKDWISATTYKGGDGGGNGRDIPIWSDGSSHVDEFFNERVQSLHSSIPAPPANFKLREDLLSGSSIKAPRSFFSLSSFRSKGKDSKPR